MPERHVLEVIQDIRAVLFIIQRGEATIQHMDQLLDLVEELDNRQEEWIL